MSEIRRFVIANDHTGVDVKWDIIKHLENSCQIINLGCDDDSVKVNYALYAFKAVETAIELNCECILICGSGEGVCIAANKVKGARAALIYNASVAKLAKQHNNANVICFGAREFDSKQIIHMLDEFINATFEGQRHQTRIDSINEYEQKTKL